MFGFGSAPGPTEKAKLEAIVARHNANMAAEGKTPTRSDAPPPILTKKTGFGKRHV